MSRKKDYSLKNTRKNTSMISALVFFILSFLIFAYYYKNLSVEKNFAVSFILTALVYYFGGFEKFAVWLYPSKQIVKTN